jgi:hypothetical protein
VRRWVPLVAAVALGVTIGAGLTFVLQNEPDAPTATLQAAPVTTAAVPTPDEQMFLVWTSDGLPPGFADGVRALPGVERVTVVLGDVNEMTASYDAQGRLVDSPPDGYVVPLDTLAIDPATYPDFFDKSAQAQLQALRPGEALLSESSAALRRIGPGGVIRLSNGTELTIGGVVDDEVVGAAELVVDTATAGSAGVVSERFLLVAYDAQKTAIARAIDDLVTDKSVRFRTRGETPYLRHADAVLPQVFLKKQFGEFAYRHEPGAGIVVDPAWAAENIINATAPIIGNLGPCHRALIPLIQEAMSELEQRNLAYLVDPGGYQGCWVPSLIGDPPSGVSRHSWGAAVDLNFSQSPTGLTSAVDPRLVNVMEEHGFRSGEEWIIPDPGHFEYYVPPGR